MSDLEFVSTADLIDELQARHEATVISLLTLLDDGEACNSVRYSGGAFRCLGMAQVAVDRLACGCRIDDALSDEDVL